MLEDAEAKVMIDNTDLLEGPYCGPVDNSRPESLACLIYTSGSTGKPKGVMIEHRNLRDYVFVLSRIMKSGERWAEFASFSFGASIVSSFGPLGVGATLHILSSDLRRSMDGMARYFITTSPGLSSIHRWALTCSPVSKIFISERCWWGERP